MSHVWVGKNKIVTVALGCSFLWPCVRYVIAHCPLIPRYIQRGIVSPKFTCSQCDITHTAQYANSELVNQVLRVRLQFVEPGGYLNKINI